MKKIMFVILDGLVLLLFIVFAVIANFVLHDDTKCISMTILAIGWGIRTTIHLVNLFEDPNDTQDEDK